jgi:hypothetical protein
MAVNLLFQFTYRSMLWTGSNFDESWWEVSLRAQLISSQLSSTLMQLLFAFHRWYNSWEKSHANANSRFSTLTNENFNWKLFFLLYFVCSRNGRKWRNILYSCTGNYTQTLKWTDKIWTAKVNVQSPYLHWTCRSGSLRNIGCHHRSLRFFLA